MLRRKWGQEREGTGSSMVVPKFWSFIIIISWREDVNERNLTYDGRLFRIVKLVIYQWSRNASA